MRKVYSANNNKIRNGLSLSCAHVTIETTPRLGYVMILFPLTLIHA